MKLISSVQTVLGAVPVSDLGALDYHEHLFQATPLLPGDELDDEPSSQAEAASLRQSGFAAIVEATPIGLGRRPEALARISAATHLHILATTGAHREQHYGSGHWLLNESEDGLIERFYADVTSGMPVSDGPERAATAAVPDGSPVRASVVKLGIGYWSMTLFERRVLAAVAATWHRTGAAIMVHLEHGSAAFEVLEAFARYQVPASAVSLAHTDRNPDPILHTELAAAGAYVGYDGWARTQRWPDSVLLSCLLESAARGASHRLLLGGDVARRTRYHSYGGMPGLSYVGRRVVPQLKRGASMELVRAVLVVNPARWLSGEETAELSGGDL
jgi:predicted metal-dependent phosphotriesterase family hydrolase